MTLSLRARLFLADVLVVGVAIGLVTVLASHEQRRWLIAHEEAGLERMVRQVAARLATEAVQGGDLQDFANSIAQLVGYRVTLIDVTGRVRADSGVPRERLSTLDNHAGRPEVRDALAGRVGRVLRFSHTLGVDLLYVAVPASVGGIAVVRLAEPLTVIAGLDRSLWRLSLAVATLALLLSIPVTLWVSGRQASRMRSLQRVTERIGVGEPEARARERPDDELGRLGGAINAMAAELRARLAALERERDERERILTHMRDGVVLIDGAGRVLRMNRSLSEILGMPAPAAVGTPFPEFVRSPELDDLVRAARAQGRPVERELRLWTPGARLVHATATPLSGGGRDAVLLVLHDLTESEALHRVRQDFVANVSHELRTPLTSLRGYAETLLEGGLDDTEHREGFVRIMRDQAARLEALVEDLMSLAELERPGATLRPERFSWGDVVRSQAAAFRPAAERKGLAIELEGDESNADLDVIAERGRIEAVVANLVDNAIKYTDRGRVVVRWGGDTQYVWCEVEDSGAGISEDDQARIFERFYRVDKARSRAVGGTGLGLSIVKHVAVLHEGEVSVRSEPGSGSTFRFAIPRGIERKKK